MFELASLFTRNPPARDKFLSRLFGIFSEEIAQCWFDDPKSYYDNLSRPTIRLIGEKKGYTLDFTLRDKHDDKVYIGEMKCELEYENYRYLTLISASQLEHHKGRAFKMFLDTVPNRQRYTVTVRGRAQPVDGAILVWGHCTSDGRASVQREYGLHTVLSLQDMINDLLQWENEKFFALIKKRQAWCNELFGGIISLSK